MLAKESEDFLDPPCRFSRKFWILELKMIVKCVDDYECTIIIILDNFSYHVKEYFEAV